ncbi:unnamed protein product, partial [Sphacelaria rigidula]
VQHSSVEQRPAVYSMVRQCMSMDEDFDVDFSDDFLREVDEAEAAASLQHDTRRRSCLKSSPSGAARAHDLVSTSGPTQMGEPDEPRKCGDGRVCNERNPGCGRCSEASEANAGYPTGDTAHED